MATYEPKRQRTDPTAKAPEDEKPKSPMATAKDLIQASVESLQPEAATILNRLGGEYLVCQPRHYAKTLQIDKFENNEEYIPKSVRIKFELSSSKIVKQGEEFASLV